ncbi:MAG TPA: siderophore ABC transporter substrate-binding protein [Ancylobacter sp.]
MRAAPFHAFRRLALSVLAAVALLAAPATAAEITIKHARGETVLRERPRTVLVFDLAVLDTLDALGVEVTGVPGSHIPDFLSKYRDSRYVKIGSLFDPDFEAVNAAAPDLIIVAARSSSAYPALSRIAPTIDLTLPSTNFIAGVRGNVETLGRIFGKETEARALVAKMNEAAARIRRDAQKAGTALMVMVNGGKLTVYGPGSRFGWLHDELGLIPAVPDAQAATHGEAVSFEFLLKTDPDWLIVLDRDAAVGQAGTSARQVLDNELIAATKAAKSGRIVYVDPARWYIVGGGGAAFTTIVQDMAVALEAKPQP